MFKMFRNCHTQLHPSVSLIVTMNSDRTRQILSGDGDRVLGYAVALNKIALIGDVDYWTSVQHGFYRLLDMLILRLHIRMTDIVYMNHHILGKRILKLENFCIKKDNGETEKERKEAI